MSKLYFFSNGQYLRNDINRDAADSGYPLSVSGYWTGMPAACVEAAINWRNGFVYFFAGSQYYRFNTKTDQVESGFPLPIAGNWTGLTLDRVDACIHYGNRKAYFFRGSQYWRYDINKDAVDPGSPLPIAGNWPGLFPSGVRAPVELGYAGCDRSGYPGDAAMTALWHNTNLRWRGFYLTPAPNPGAKLGWMTRRDFLVSLGWGLAPIYVGEQQIKFCKTCSANPSTAKGITDAAVAINLATTAGFAAGSVITSTSKPGTKSTASCATTTRAGSRASSRRRSPARSVLLLRDCEAIEGIRQPARVLGLQHQQIRGSSQGLVPESAARSRASA
jgi:hypothetical protein